jgi:hypothetical protein
MATFPDWLDKTEARTINKIITRALDLGMHIRVREGEEGEILTEWTTHRGRIQTETAASGITIFDIAHVSTTERIGSIVLIHGNGEDVFSDMTAPNEEMLTAMETYFPSEAFEAA